MIRAQDSEGVYVTSNSYCVYSEADCGFKCDVVFSLLRLRQSEVKAYKRTDH